MQALDQDQPIMMLAGKPVPKEELIYLISKGNPAELGKGLLSREEFEENLAVFIDFKLKLSKNLSVKSLSSINPTFFISLSISIFASSKHISIKFL
jgi:hypothetical protein